MGYVSNVLYLSLPIAASVLLIGLRASGRRQAGIPAFLTGILSLFTLPSIYENLVRIYVTWQGIPLRSSEDIMTFVLMLGIMPVIGILLLGVGHVVSREAADEERRRSESPY